jgi:hypothetical protein
MGLQNQKFEMQYQIDIQTNFANKTKKVAHFGNGSSKLRN